MMSQSLIGKLWTFQTFIILLYSGNALFHQGVSGVKLLVVVKAFSSCKILKREAL